MQLRKYYGRTLGGVMGQVRRALGPDALVLETRALDPDSPEGRLNPGARFEICAVRDDGVKTADRQPKHEDFYTRAQASGLKQATSALHSASGRAQEARTSVLSATQAGSGSELPGRRAEFLKDLGALRGQLRDLLDGDKMDSAAGVDLRDYHALLEMGIAPAVLAPHFRRWLEWRTATPALRQYLVQREAKGPAARMKNAGLREWLWLAWGDGLGFSQEADLAQNQAAKKATRILGVVGPSGSGKTTTLAKISSINCHNDRQNNAIITFDTFRFGAAEQWRRTAKLMNLNVEIITTPAELGISMEKWNHYDQVAIDTPGGMTPDSAAGRLYGAVLAQCPLIETLLVLPATHQEDVSRAQMSRAESLGARRLVVTKLDETPRKGGIVNLTMDSHWTIDSFTMGSRVPDDFTRADRRALWGHVLAPSHEAAAVTMAGAI